MLAIPDGPKRLPNFADWIENENVQQNSRIKGSDETLVEKQNLNVASAR